jgi:ssDNA thymidine ADP-ribosyltransferase, DarT
MRRPERPKIYHIVHVDRLASIAVDGYLFSDAVISERGGAGTTIGMGKIKERRLTLPIGCQPGLYVGKCVPFYWCPRSVMLFLIHRDNHPDLTYHGGQEPIVHLEADLVRTIDWAEEHGKRWAFTLSNAGAYYFEDRCELGQLNEINWEAVSATKWSGRGVAAAAKEGKQAEFLIEDCFPWELVERIGVRSLAVVNRADQALAGNAHHPVIEVRADWYYLD